MAVQPISLGVSSEPAKDSAAGPARLINCYAESAGPAGKALYPVYACDGFSSFGSIASGGLTRAMLSFNEQLAYGVSGQRLFRFSTGGTIVDMGAFATSGTVTMARNRQQPTGEIAVCSSDGLFRVIQNLTSVATPTLPAGAGTPNSVCAIDGYFVLTYPSGEFYITSIDAGTVIDELDFAAAEANPDGLLVGAVRGRDLVLIGSRSIEFWQNTGVNDFPFQRAASVSVGCYAAGSVAEIVMLGGEGGAPSDSVVFAATDSLGHFIGVHALDGYGTRKISTHSVDRAIRQEGTSVANIGATVWSRDGHVFYAIYGSTFTWVFDTVTGLWHERTSAGLNRWRVAKTCALSNRIFAGDYTNGGLYEMSPTVIAAADSVLSVETSNDNGSTYDVARTKTISQSDRKQRFNFNRFGQSGEDGKVVRLKISNAVSEAGTGNDMTIIPPMIHSYPNPLRFQRMFVDVVPASSQTTRPKGILSLAADVYTVKG